MGKFVQLAVDRHLAAARAGVGLRGESALGSNHRVVNNCVSVVEEFQNRNARFGDRAVASGVRGMGGPSFWKRL